MLMNLANISLPNFGSGKDGAMGGCCSAGHENLLVAYLG
jgi:hypothetical protein